MKAGAAVFASSSFSSPTKRRWKCLAVSVLCLVFLSMLVPLVFVLGFYNGLYNGFVADRLNSVANSIRVPAQHGTAELENQPKVNVATRAGGFMRRFSSSFPMNNWPQVPEFNSENMAGGHVSEMMCEIKFGTYCLWRRRQREKMEDSVVRKMKDLLFVARAYYPSIAKLPKFEQLAQEMKQNIQEFEHLLSEASSDEDLPSNNEPKIMTMEDVISKAKSCPVECNNVEKKFRQLVDLTEDEADFHMKQSVFLYKLAVQTIPKSLHCLSMRLTVEYFRSSSDADREVVPRFSDADSYHHVIFSKNILASSVVINSTVLHARESGKLVFHLLTDNENYLAMKFWFFTNKFGDAAVQVLNIDDFKLYDHHEEGPSHLSLPDEFCISFYLVDEISSSQVRTQYLSMFSHSQYFLPEIFPSLEKVVVLDDDIVVQRDLSDLWNLDMAEKVIAAVQSCAVKLSYLQSSSFDENSCAWTSGVNLFDLSRWRMHNVSEKYHRLVQEMSENSGISDVSKLTASLLAFEGLVHPLDTSWMLSGLGHNYSIDPESLRTAAVLHYDGSMKPWLELGIPDYKSFWRKFLDPDSRFLNDCNVNQ